MNPPPRIPRRWYTYERRQVVADVVWFFVLVVAVIAVVRFVSWLI